MTPACNVPKSGKNFYLSVQCDFKRAYFCVKRQPKKSLGYKRKLLCNKITLCMIIGF